MITECTSFSSVHRGFGKLNVKQFSANFKELVIYQIIFSDHNTLKLEINYKK